jgi:hypothetical protein
MAIDVNVRGASTPYPVARATSSLGQPYTSFGNTDEGVGQGDQFAYSQATASTSANNARFDLSEAGLHYVKGVVSPLSNALKALHSF